MRRVMIREKVEKTGLNNGVALKDNDRDKSRRSEGMSHNTQLPIENSNSETNILSISGEDEKNLQSILIDSAMVEKISSEIIEAQETYFADIDDGCLEKDVIDDKIYNEVLEAKRKGAFIPVQGMKLIYGGENRTKIFAKRVSKKGNNGEPVLIFAYTDGRISDEIEIKLEHLVKLSFLKYGRTQEVVDKKSATSAERLIEKIGGKIIPYWAFDIEINIVELLKLLTSNLSTLPLDSGNQLDVSIAYWSIYKYVQKLKGNPHKCYLERRGFYALTREDMVEIASKLNSTIPEIIKILKNNGLLHLQISSIGYQCEVKGVGNCYCIKILAKYQPQSIEDFSGNGFEEL